MYMLLQGENYIRTRWWQGRRSPEREEGPQKGRHAYALYLRPCLPA